MPLKPEDMIDHVKECMWSPPDEGQLFGRRLLRQRLKDEGVAAYNRQLPIREKNDRAHTVINNMYHQQMEKKEPVICTILRHGDIEEKPKPPLADVRPASKAVQVVPGSLEQNDVSEPPQRADPANPQIVHKLTKGAFIDSNSGVEKRNAAVEASPADCPREPPLRVAKAAGKEARSIAVDTSSNRPVTTHAVTHPMDKAPVPKSVPKPTWKTHTAVNVNTDLKGFAWDRDLSELPKVGSLNPAFKAVSVKQSPRPKTARSANRPQDSIRFLF